MPSLRLMTYNVRYFGHGTRGLVATRETVRRIAEAVAAMSPLCDVICLQEVEEHSLRSAPVTWHRSEPRTQLGEWLSELERALHHRHVEGRYEAHYFPAHRYALTRSTDLYTTGLAVLVGPRLRVVSEEEDRLEDITFRRGVKALKQTRICAHLALRVRDEYRESTGSDSGEEGDLDVFNTHLSLPGPFYPEFWSSPERMGFGPNQLEEARRLVAAIRRRRRSPRMVLVGDFNSVPDSPVDRFLREEAGLDDALASALGLRGDERARWATAGFMQLRMAIDRVYSSGGVRWLDFDESAPFDGASRFEGLSDHVPIVGRLRLE